jgi:hypothetical protein
MSPKDIFDYPLALAGASAPWWFENLNEGILVPIATFAGIIYLAFKIYYLVKYKGKNE